MKYISPIKFIPKKTKRVEKIYIMSFPISKKIKYFVESNKIGILSIF